MISLARRIFQDAGLQVSRSIDLVTGGLLLASWTRHLQRIDAEAARIGALLMGQVFGAVMHGGDLVGTCAFPSICDALKKQVVEVLELCRER